MSDKLKNHHPLTHIPILVEYRLYPGIGKAGITMVRTDVAVAEALAQKKTLCEIAIDYCREEGLDVTGNAKISDTGIWAPAVAECEFKGNCRTIDYGQPCAKISTCTQRG